MEYVFFHWNLCFLSRFSRNLGCFFCLMNVRNFGEKSLSFIRRLSFLLKKMTIATLYNTGSLYTKNNPYIQTKKENEKKKLKLYRYLYKYMYMYNVHVQYCTCTCTMYSIVQKILISSQNKTKQKQNKAKTSPNKPKRSQNKSRTSLVQKNKKTKSKKPEARAYKSKGDASPRDENAAGAAINFFFFISDLLSVTFAFAFWSVTFA